MTSRLPRICLVLAASAIAATAAGFPNEFLNKPDAWFNSEEGRKTTSCVLSWQSEGGAWPKNGNSTKSMNPGSRARIEGTFDNSATTQELRYLARAYQATNDEVCKTGFLLGFDCILQAQYPNGGWPQLYPLTKKAYPHHITFNDNSMVRLMQFLDEVTSGDTCAFVDESRRDAARNAVQHGVECIIRCQVIVHGTATVWCAQHDEVTLAPATARAYELPSLSGSESAGIVRYLMSIENPSPAVIQCVKSAAAWFNSAQLTGLRIEVIHGDRQVIEDSKASPLWARFYDLDTGKPFFCDRDGVRKSQLSEIGKERRNGYAWYGNWGDSVAREFARWPHR